MRRDIGILFWLGVNLCVVGMVCAPRAAAFSDPTRYSEPTDTGGSAGRHFTGSPLDGYGCNSCHRGGTAIPVGVSGLPLDGYEPGATYEVVIRLDKANPQQEPHASLVLEFADEMRRPAGTISPPPIPEDASQFPTEELCVEDGVVTGFALRPLPNDDGRNLIAIPECGARAVRFFWTAPATSVGTIWMAGGVVSSDEQASPEGDGVTLLRRPLLPKAGQAYLREIASGCSSLGVTGPRLACSPTLLSVSLISVVALGIRAGARRRGLRKETHHVEERT